MTHKPNDFKENRFSFFFLHSSIHQALMNSWEGRNANAVSGTWGGNESDRWSGWGWRLQKAIIAVMNESGGRSPQAVTQSLRQDPVAPPNFITMTQSHQHTPSDGSANTTGGLEQDLAKQVWVQRGLQPLELRRGINYRHFALCILLTAHRHCLLSIKR